MKGAPHSICFTGQLFGEETLLAVADTWQRSGRHHLRHPPMPFLSGVREAGAGGR